MNQKRGESCDIFLYWPSKCFLLNFPLHYFQSSSILLITTHRNLLTRRDVFPIIIIFHGAAQKNVSRVAVLFPPSMIWAFGLMRISSRCLDGPLHTSSLHAFLSFTHLLLFKFHTVLLCCECVSASTLSPTPTARSSKQKASKQATPLRSVAGKAAHHLACPFPPLCSTLSYPRITVHQPLA